MAATADNGDSFVNVYLWAHSGRTGLRNNAMSLLVIHILQMGTWQFVNWFSLKTTALETKCSQRKACVEMRSERENPSQFWQGHSRRLWTQKLQFIFIFPHPHNWRIKSPFCSLPLLPCFTPTPLLSISFLKMVEKWNKVEALSNLFISKRQHQTPSSDFQLTWNLSVYQRLF